jgi:hypothetical protein
MSSYMEHSHISFVFVYHKRKFCDLFFWRTKTQKKVHLIFGAQIKNTALVPKCSYATSPLYDAVLVDVEVAALQDDCVW